MRATHQLKYAIYGIFDLAYHGSQRPIPIQEIGRRQGIPVRYLEQIFQRLRRAGLVVSKRGPGGGYSLARPPEEISLADVVVAVQGVLISRSAEPGEEARECPGFVWAMLDDALESALESRSVADLCREAARRGVDRAASEPAMYHI
jgi:Rrf2 family iron-sulfur cluster assembly transcriptional regulator